jgi:hypothetical protein
MSEMPPISDTHNLAVGPTLGRRFQTPGADFRHPQSGGGADFSGPEGRNLSVAVGGRLESSASGIVGSRSRWVSGIVSGIVGLWNRRHVGGCLESSALVGVWNCRPPNQ